jgi:O-antigen/teichoic acid export membrane protein
MTLVLAFVINAGLNFVLGLAVAKFLGPDLFGRYAVAMAVAVVVNTTCFEWLRLSATRFYSDRTRETDPAVRATLELGYAVITLALVGLVLAAVLSGVDVGLPASLLAGATAAGIGFGVFDYRAALARARFLERSYLEIVLFKNALSFVLMVGGAYLTHDPALVVAGAAVSAGAAVLVARQALSDPGLGFRLAERRQIASFAAYAVPLVAANILYQLLPLMNRTALAWRDGYAEAGQFSLAADLGLRLFMTLGSALDILLFQLAVRTDAHEGRAAAERQIGRNIALVFALMLPFGAGLWLVLPGLEALIVPAAYQGPFARYTALLIPAFFGFAFIQYALNPVFQLRKETAPVVVAALVAVGVNGALLLVLPDLLGPAGVAVAQVAGFASATLVVAVLALRSHGAALPWRDLALSVIATTAMALAVMPLRQLQPAGLALAASAALGILVYAILAYAFDIASLRSILSRRAARPSLVAPAE